MTFTSAGVGVGVEEARVLVERGHPLAHAALCHALRLQQRIHPRLDLGILLQPDLVDLGRTARGGGAQPQRPVVIGLAIRQVPHPSLHPGLFGNGGERGNLPIERGIDRALDQLCRARPMALQPQRAGLGGQIGNQRLCRCRGGAEALEDAQRGFSDEAWRRHPARGIGLHRGRFLVDHPAQRGNAGQIGLGVGGIGNRVGRDQQFGRL